ncbi:ATP-binding protein [Zunongwangia endophytica]|uniref:ATP-binding protein n=1 Tax=Zunongwangia endophytica TaxID=1808945 RepID=A0ABV8H6P2_9FLAO|nr:ATP-binding protein [Zunongwangia endophytica]MDN3595982.1 ATP-binding protein [Zunongwangia endophytica]
MENRNPFEHNYFIGYINYVSAQFVKVHFPSSTLLQSFTFKGENLNGGLVGNFVVIEGEQFGFLGKIQELSLPEKERLEFSEKSFKNSDFHPTGKIEILLSFDLFEPTKIDKGLNALPVIGAKVFVCSSNFIRSYFRKFGIKHEHLQTSPVFELGKLTFDKSAPIEVSQQAIFGRHCAVVGTTGGGKSYTVSKLLEGIVSNNGKAIIVDATGEYSTHDKNSYSDIPATLSTNSFFHYSNLTVGDLFVLLRPSGQVQQPVLLDAIHSLKLVQIAKRENRNLEQIKDGILIKKQALKRPIFDLYNEFSEEIEKSNADFDIQKLTQQLRRECVYDSHKFGEDITRWGDLDKRKFENSTSLFLRTENLIQTESFKNIFGFGKQKTDEGELATRISDFLNGDKKILRIGFENVGFDFQAREIVANAIGKYLLEMARKGKFNEKPLVLFVDEAHQYLNKSVKDEYFELTQLNSFDSIAKECRKYGLFLTIATQMPRDIPLGTLSQIGTFIIHRLINHYDKEAIANASSSANRNTLDFLPVLGAGEAILMGVDFPMSVMLKINKPLTPPNSNTPQFKI